MQYRTSKEERELGLIPVKLSHPPEYSTFQTRRCNCALCDLVKASQLDFHKPQSNRTVTVQNQNANVFQKKNVLGEENSGNEQTKKRTKNFML